MYVYLYIIIHSYKIISINKIPTQFHPIQQFNKWKKKKLNNGRITYAKSHNEIVRTTTLLCFSSKFYNNVT